MRIPGKYPVLTVAARLAPYLLVAACLAVIIVLLQLAQYSHPSSDDFCMASGVRENGLLLQLWNHYFEWSGRYTANALYALYPMVFGLFDGYGYIPAVFILALFLASSFLMATISGARMTARPVLLAALVFVCVYLLGLTSPASSLYWMAGAMTYQSANVLLLIVAALMLKLHWSRPQSRTTAILLTGLLLLTVLAVGTNETSMIAVLVMAGFGVVMHLASGTRTLITWLMILLVTAIGCFIVYISPGNEIRAADFPLRHDMTRSLNGSIVVGFKVLWLWLSNPVLIVATLLVPFVVNRFAGMTENARLRSLSLVPPSLISILVLVTLSVPFLFQFPAWWAMGGWPPARTLDAIYFIFLLGWFCSLGMITLRFIYRDTDSETNGYPAINNPVVVLLLAVLFTLAALNGNIVTTAKSDLVSRAPAYSAYLDARYQAIDQALVEGRQFLSVDDFDREFPRSIYFNDIMHDVGHWRNTCYAEYFGLKAIRRSKQKTTINRN